MCHRWVIICSIDVKMRVFFTKNTGVLIKCFLISTRVTVQELERLLAFNRSFATAEVNAFGRIAGAIVRRHERRTEQRKTTNGDRKRGIECGHDDRLEHGTNSGTTERRLASCKQRKGRSIAEGYQHSRWVDD